MALQVFVNIVGAKNNDLAMPGRPTDQYENIDER